VRESSNPVFRNLNRENAQGGQGVNAQQPYQGYNPQGAQGYNMGTGMAGAAQGMQFGPQFQGQAPYQQGTDSRSMTIDDVVTKTAMTLGVVVVFALASYFLVAQNLSLATPLAIIGGLGGFVLVMIASFARKSDNPAIVLAYAVFEGLFVGSISYVFANVMVQGISAGSLLAQAILGTFGVFIGMLVVYKTGAIRVTPRFTKMLIAALFGVVVLSLGNLVIGLFTGTAGLLRDGGTFAIVFSLVCIGIAAFSFLLDFDQADQLIRAGAPAKAAWGVALGLTVTLVWLYTEILRLLSYFYRSN
jgi:uncharacterized YccA/Bax inhibitor family protein